jgi:hypothetical protein
MIPIISRFLLKIKVNSPIFAVFHIVPQPAYEIPRFSDLGRCPLSRTCFLHGIEGAGLAALDDRHGCCKVPAFDHRVKDLDLAVFPWASMLVTPKPAWKAVLSCRMVAFGAREKDPYDQRAHGQPVLDAQPT